MLMRVVVAVITALIMIVAGVFFMFMWLVGTNGYNTTMGTTILIANLVVIIIAIVISSVSSGWLAHFLQQRSGMSPWLAGPLAIVAVTAVSVVAIFLLGILIVGVVDSTRKRPPQRQQPPPVNRRGG